MDSSLSTLNEIDDIKIARAIQCDIEDLARNIPVKDNDLKIMSQNIRSIYANIDGLNANLIAVDVIPDILILTECRLNPDKPTPILANYTSYETTNKLNQNDGVVVYVRNEIIVKKVKEVKLDHASCVQIDTFNSSILGIYRSPSNINADIFINSLNSHLESLKLYKNIILTGDININLIAHDSERAYERNNRINYLNMLSMHSLMPSHTFPTREASCLDHFMLKLEKDKSSAQVAVLNTSITDHAMIFLNLSYQTYCKKCINIKTVTDFNKALISLKEKNLSELLFCDNPNILIERFINVIFESLQENTNTVHVPSSKRLIKPWITSGILRCIRNRNTLHKKVQSDPHNDILKISYKRYRNFCNNLIKKCKRNYEREQLEKSTKNSKSLWKSIKSITYGNKNTKYDNTKLLSIKTSPTESVNYVNEYFTNIGKELAENLTLNSSSQIQTHDTQNPQVNSFVLLETDPQEVHDVLMSLKSDSAPGWDNIPTSFLKLAKNEVCPIISYLTNLCFNIGIFPNILKQSIITPVHKNGDMDNVSNYRPISVLPSISKILEKLINKRLISYLDKFKIISDSQYGFRNGRSTEDAVSALCTYIVHEVDNGKKCLAVYLDLKKAFDTVCVPFLINKLENIGIRDTPLALFRDYLCERKQRVKIGKHISRDSNITYGVPQGSVLGPTLFLVYIDGLCNLKIGDAKFISYADDTAVVFSNHTWDSVRLDAEMGLAKIANWLEANLLTLNAQKTNYMCYTIYNRTQPGRSFNIRIHNSDGRHDKQCNCPIINKVSSTKYLGVMLDQNLKWYPQIEVLSNRVRKLVWIFKALRHVAQKPLLSKIYIALAQSVLGYCISIWGGAAKTKFIEVERAQRVLVKVMYFKSYSFSTNLLYSMSNLLSVRKIYITQVILKKHKMLTYDPSIVNRRRKDNIAKVIGTKTAFARRQYAKQSAHLYNLINKSLNIYPMQYHDCKKVLTEWIQTKNYGETEALLHFMS